MRQQPAAPRPSRVLPSPPPSPPVVSLLIPLAPARSLASLALLTYFTFCQFTHPSALTIAAFDASAADTSSATNERSGSRDRCACSRDRLEERLFGCVHRPL